MRSFSFVIPLLVLLLLSFHGVNSLPIQSPGLRLKTCATPVRYENETLVRVSIPPTVIPDPDSVRAQLVGKLRKIKSLDVWELLALNDGSRAVDVRVKSAKGFQSLVSSTTQRTTTLLAYDPDSCCSYPSKRPDTNAEIVQFFYSMSAAYPTLVSVNGSIGKSYEGQDLIMVRIGALPPKAPGVKQVYTQGLIHAREWVSGSTLQYLAHKLVSSFSDPADPDHNWAVETLEKGTDPDGASTEIDYEDYQGPTPLSEPETQVITANFLSTLTSAVLSIHYHSYSQLILRPPGYTYDVKSDQEAKLKEAGQAGAAAIAAQSGKVYTSQIYVTTGTAADWAWDSTVDSKVTNDRNGTGRVYSYTIELRPTPEEGGFGLGFRLSPTEIAPTSEENWAALKAILDYVLANVIRSTRKLSPALLVVHFHCLQFNRLLWPHHNTPPMTDRILRDKTLPNVTAALLASAALLAGSTHSHLLFLSPYPPSPLTSDASVDVAAAVTVQYLRTWAVTGPRWYARLEWANRWIALPSLFTVHVMRNGRGADYLSAGLYVVALLWRFFWYRPALSAVLALVSPASSSSLISSILSPSKPDVRPVAELLSSLGSRQRAVLLINLATLGTAERVLQWVLVIAVGLQVAAEVIDWYMDRERDGWED
ncbi:Zn-dependent exopeptidase [Gonapodya prolifera JEL478]|uniref:Zn-dependent exopeptidase n=1 Tax=Gonapodya prolifera (strain JEL478) TaxID=1344416 RepID=A0A139AKB8_GONPJ|nr:Zn-dependent exopeptidase [Gonapodya prolifera JEL478]|eukprot:KXS17219.1 Zn-dependent exopeptidase [Gonapodya prolifera JEL478]